MDLGDFNGTSSIIGQKIVKRYYELSTVLLLGFLDVEPHLLGEGSDGADGLAVGNRLSVHLQLLKVKFF